MNRPPPRKGAFVIYRPETTSNRLEDYLFKKGQWAPSQSYEHRLWDVTNQMTPAEAYRHRLATDGKLIRILQRLEWRWQKAYELWWKSAGFLSLFQNQKRLGATLLALGLLFTTFGMMLFFEGNLLRLGNMFMISGITFLLGPNKVRGFFMKAERMQATIITGVGVFLVFTGKPRMGILCEIFGLLNLFGNMFPYLLAIGKNIPIVGDVIKSFTGEGSKAAF